MESSKEILETMAAASDRMCLRWIEEGVPVYDDEGGIKYLRCPNAAELQAILKRLGQCNITVKGTADSDAGRMVEILARVGNFKDPEDLPPVSLEDDAATG